MAKSKSKLSISALLTFITGILGFVMFFLPNINQSFFGTTDTSSGLNMFTGMFSLDDATASTIAMFDGNNGNVLAYIIAILFIVSAIALLVCALISCLNLLGVKVDYSLVKKISLIAVVLLAIATIFVIIRFSQIDGINSVLGYGLILELIFALATALIPMFIKK